MKTLITYYSYSGITDKVAHMFADALRKKGSVEMQRLKPKDEIASFFGQCKAAFSRKRAALDDSVTFDVSPYDIVLVGSPVWAFAPTPALNTYLDKMNGLSGKRAIVFLTSGSGAGVKRCFENIRTVLQSKGASGIDEINIPNSKMKDTAFIASLIEKIV